MASIMNSLGQTLKMGDLSSHPDQDYITDSRGHLYCLHLRLGRVVELQRQFGTGRVSYSPHPLLAIVPNTRIERQSLLLIICGPTTSRESLSRILPHLSGRFEQTLQLEEVSLDVGMIVVLLRQASLLLLYGLKDGLLCWLAAGACSPFFVVGEMPVELPRFLAGAGVISNHVPHLDDYYQIKQGLRDLLDLDPKIFTSRLAAQVQKSRLLLRWVPGGVAFRDSSFDSATPGPLAGEAPLRLCISPQDYHWPCLRRAAESLALYNCPGGIHLELACLHTFLDLGALYLHPWLGMIESSHLETVEMLLDRPNFIHSCLACVGLLVLSSEIQLHLRARLDLMELPVPVRLCGPPVQPEPQFSLEMWQEGGRPLELGLSDSPGNALPVFRKPRLYGELYEALGQSRPPICPPSPLTELLLGQDYPLLTEELEPFQLRHFATPERVRAALAHLRETLVGPSAWLRELAGSRVGSIIKRISRENVAD